MHRSEQTPITVITRVLRISNTVKAALEPRQPAVVRADVAGGGSSRRWSGGSGKPLQAADDAGDRAR
jgi:hypothetical protein